MPPRPRHPMPDSIRQALNKRRLIDAYRSRPSYQQNDYIGWIQGAEREETRQKRLAQMLEELEGGRLYMGIKWMKKPATNSRRG